MTALRSGNETGGAAATGAGFGAGAGGGAAEARGEGAGGGGGATGVEADLGTTGEEGSGLAAAADGLPESSNRPSWISASSRFFAPATVNPSS